jgi:hypothetical protein
MIRCTPAHAIRRPVAWRQRRAFTLMLGLAGVCVVLALAPAADQLVRHGLHEFAVRPPGVGASPALPDQTVGHDGSSHPTSGAGPIAPVAKGAAASSSALDSARHGEDGMDVGALLAPFSLGGAIGLALAVYRRPAGRAILAAHHSA